MPRIRAGTLAEHKVVARQQIVDAGYRLFVSQGYERTRLTEVAALIGMGRTTLYEYFPGKQQLLYAVVDSYVRPVLSDALAGLTEDEVEERVAQLFTIAFDLVAKNPAAGFLLFRVSSELPHDERDRVWESAAPFSREIRRLCHVAVDAGDIEPACGDRLAQAVLDLLGGGIDEVLASGDVAVTAPLVLADRLRFLRSGIAPWLHPVDSSASCETDSDGSGETLVVDG